MFHKIKAHTISFTHAVAGIQTACKTQPNFRIHLFIASVVILAGWYLKLTALEWALLTFTILWVLLSEMLNTAIESMVDLITVDYRQQAKVAKDVAAGAVLLGAIGSIIVGLIIFIPKLI